MSPIRNLYENLVHAPFIRALFLSLAIAFFVFFDKDVNKEIVFEFVSKVNFLLIMGNVSLVILTSPSNSNFGKLTEFKNSIVIATLYLIYYFWGDLSIFIVAEIGK